MSDYVRTQILLEKKQRAQLNKIAEDLGISFSDLIRRFLSTQIRERTYVEMRLVAEQLFDDYTNGEQLTVMTELDGEDFINV